MTEESGISTYPVGLLADIKHGRARSGLRRHLLRHVKARNWRAARSYLNGYLAEWHYRPDAIRCHQAGRGWTRRAAIRRLGVHIAEQNLTSRERTR